MSANDQIRGFSDGAEAEADVDDDVVGAFLDSVSGDLLQSSSDFLSPEAADEDGDESAELDEEFRRRRLFSSAPPRLAEAALAAAAVAGEGEEEEEDFSGDDDEVGDALVLRNNVAEPDRREVDEGKVEALKRI